MSAGQAVLLVGSSLVIIAVVIAVMIRLDRVHHRRQMRRHGDIYRPHDHHPAYGEAPGPPTAP